ncbi:MAG: NUDIX domain-containing protein [Patescibacteria group bacterium]|jgi:mutator protein MutT
MPHIHELIDFVATGYIVHDDKILLIFHKQLKRWLPVGGHIELNEDPEHALFREIKEESGIDSSQLTVLSSKPDIANDPITDLLYAPNRLEIHDITDTHRHVNLAYYLKSSTDKIQLAPDEHDEIRWFIEQDLENADFDLLPTVKCYCKEAISKARNIPQKQITIAIGIVEHEGRFLILRRLDINPMWNHKWEFPGGKIEFGEIPEQACVREVKEETGLDINNLELLGLHTDYWHLPDKEIQVQLVIYRAAYVGGDVVLDSNEDDEYKWVTLDEYLAMQDHLHPNINLVKALYEPFVRSRVL